MAQVLHDAALLLTIILVGWGVKRLGWLAETDFRVISLIVLRVTLPCALLTVADDVTLGESALWLLGLGIVINLVQEAAAFLLERRRGRRAQAFAVLNTGGHNLGLFTMPYLSGLIGPSAIPPALVFDITNSWGAGGTGYGWGLALAREDSRVTLWAIVRQMFRSPVFLTYLVILVLRLLDASLPAIVLDFTSLVGQANTFLAMFMLGVGLRLALPRARLATAVRLLTLRYVLAVVAALLTWFFVPLDDFTRMILCAVYFSPVPAMASGFTEEARGDVQLSAFLTSVSILVALVTIPAVVLWAGT